VIKTLDNYLLLEIDLETGRHHQIRAQLSKTGVPIKGDLKYGAPRSNPDGGINLHARKLEFIHPVTKENIEIIALFRRMMRSGELVKNNKSCKQAGFSFIMNIFNFIYFLYLF
jgi:23S rRNA-/tRNA-specific pseudouridylate synthase